MEIAMREPTLVRILTSAGFWQFFQDPVWKLWSEHGDPVGPILVI